MRHQKQNLLANFFNSMRLQTENLLVLFLLAGLALGQMETLQPPIRRGRKPRLGVHFAQRCEISITAPDPNPEVPAGDVVISTKVVCNDKVLYDKKEQLSTLTDTKVGDGIRLFAKSRAGGWTYLLFEDGEPFQLVNSYFENLPPFPGIDTVAPVIVDGTKGWISDSRFQGNKGFRVAGAVYATSVLETRAKVELFDSKILDNSADGAGALAADEHAEIAASDSEFSGNFGKEAGAITVKAFGAVDLENCTVEGAGVSDNFMRFILGETDDLLGEVISKAGALLSDNYARVELQECNFKYHAGTQGTVMALQDTSLYMEDCVFTSNAAEIGGAVYMEGQYGNTGKAFWTNFEKNTARHGGALTVFGDGVFSLYKSDFNGNSAQHGGAVFSGHSSISMKNDAGCKDPSQGSRISANYSSFAANVAIQNGGAVFSQCAQVLLNQATFENNEAGSHGGGIYLDTGYQLDAPRCSFKNNTATISGGAIFASATNLVQLEDSLLHSNHAGHGGGGALLTSGVLDVHLMKTNVSENTAKGNGGALALADGSTLRIEDVILHKNEAELNGGGIYSQNVEEVRLQSTNMTENSAAKGHGGGVCAQSSGSVELNKLQLSRNLAWGSGGAIASMGAQSVTINQVVATNNTAQYQDGGAFLLDDATTVSIASGVDSTRRLKASLETNESVILEHNTAGGKGGGLCISQSGSVTLGNMKVFNNTGGDGGALAAVKVQSLDVRDSSFEANNASRGGGWSLESLGTASVHDTQLMHNNAKGIGGAISAVDVQLTMYDSKIRHNVAEKGAGVQLDGYSKLVGSTVTLENNEAQENGGGIACQDNSIIDMSDSIFTYNYAPDASSISATCSCNVTADNCAFTRDKKRNGNGDFFQSARHCSWIDTKSCSFVGAPWKLSLFWLITIICSASVVVGVGAGFVRCCVLAGGGRRKKTKDASVALLADRASSSSSSSSSGSYSSSYDEEEGQVVTNVPSKHQEARGSSTSKPRAVEDVKPAGQGNAGLDGPSMWVKPKMQILPDGNGVSLSLVTNPVDNV